MAQPCVATDKTNAFAGCALQIIQFCKLNTNLFFSLRRLSGIKRSFYWNKIEKYWQVDEWRRCEAEKEHKRTWKCCAALYTFYVPFLFCPNCKWNFLSASRRTAFFSSYGIGWAALWGFSLLKDNESVKHVVTAAGYRFGKRKTPKNSTESVRKIESKSNLETNSTSL